MDHSRLTDLHTLSNGFLTDIMVEDSRIPGAVLISASYDSTAYADDLFEKLSIPCPPKLYRAVAGRKADFLSGRAMVQAAMAQLGVPPRHVTNAANRAPVWPDGLTGSLSHARGRCAGLVSRNTNLTFGVDTEAIAQNRTLTAILTETLSPAERRIITQGPFPAATNATLAFSAKEALFKALYARVGHHFGFDAAELCAAPTDTGLTLTLTTDLAEGLTRSQRFDLHHRLTTTHVLTWLAAPSS
ncbi:MAG: 4'-phosphopantetheinyl transferase superfamily protein [Paracoccaceae bacterium]|jgi:4'-phosphopantetheinyl transferase EntD|nr:4'-phosphopantetheinyl transferase superfamily protein [Paracoccaceae bacterium]